MSIKEIHKMALEILPIEAGKYYAHSKYSQYSIDDDLQALEIDLEDGICVYKYIIRPYNQEALIEAKKNDNLRGYVKSLPLTEKKLIISINKLFELMYN